MDYLVILATLSFGVVLGMAFTIIFTTELAKADRALISKLHSDKIALINENKKLKAFSKGPVDIEVIDLPQPDKTYHQPF